MKRANRYSVILKTALATLEQKKEPEVINDTKLPDFSALEHAITSFGSLEPTRDSLTGTRDLIDEYLANVFVNIQNMTNDLVREVDDNLTQTLTNLTSAGVIDSSELAPSKRRPFSGVTHKEKSNSPNSPPSSPPSGSPKQTRPLPISKQGTGIGSLTPPKQSTSPRKEGKRKIGTSNAPSNDGGPAPNLPSGEDSTTDNVANTGGGESTAETVTIEAPMEVQIDMSVLKKSLESVKRSSSVLATTFEKVRGTIVERIVNILDDRLVLDRQSLVDYRKGIREQLMVARSATESFRRSYDAAYSHKRFEDIRILAEEMDEILKNERDSYTKQIDELQVQYTLTRQIAEKKSNKVTELEAALEEAKAIMASAAAFSDSMKGAASKTKRGSKAIRKSMIKIQSPPKPGFITTESGNGESLMNQNSFLPITSSPAPPCAKCASLEAEIQRLKTENQRLPPMQSVGQLESRMQQRAKQNSPMPLIQENTPPFHQEQAPSNSSPSQRSNPEPNIQQQQTQRPVEPSNNPPPSISQSVSNDKETKETPLISETIEIKAQSGDQKMKDSNTEMNQHEHGHEQEQEKVQNIDTQMKSQSEGEENKGNNNSESPISTNDDAPKVATESVKADEGAIIQTEVQGVQEETENVNVVQLTLMVPPDTLPSQPSEEVTATSPMSPIISLPPPVLVPHDNGNAPVLEEDVKLPIDNVDTNRDTATVTVVAEVPVKPAEPTAESTSLPFPRKSNDNNNQDINQDNNQQQVQSLVDVVADSILQPLPQITEEITTYLSLSQQERNSDVVSIDQSIGGESDDLNESLALSMDSDGKNHDKKPENSKMKNHLPYRMEIRVDNMDLKEKELRTQISRLTESERELQMKVFALEFQNAKLTKQLLSDETKYERQEAINLLRIKERNVLLRALVDQVKSLQERIDRDLYIKKMSTPDIPIRATSSSSHSLSPTKGNHESSSHSGVKLPHIDIDLYTDPKSKSTDSLVPQGKYGPRPATTTGHNITATLRERANTAFESSRKSQSYTALGVGRTGGGSSVGSIDTVNNVDHRNGKMKKDNTVGWKGARMPMLDGELYEMLEQDSKVADSVADESIILDEESVKEITAVRRQILSLLADYLPKNKKDKDVHLATNKKLAMKLAERGAATLLPHKI